MLGTLYPAFIQQFRVKPNEQELELPYIEDNIVATRQAYALDQIQESQREVGGALTGKELAANLGTVENIRLARDPVLAENFVSCSASASTTTSSTSTSTSTSSTVGRGCSRSPCGIVQDRLSSAGQTWQNRHLSYTHGSGAVASRVDATTTDGQPLFTLQDLPPVGDPAMTQPRVYFGESNDVDFVVVGTQTNEVALDEARRHYDGEAGIQVGNLFRRALFAWHFRDYNLLVSNAIDDDSRIIINRDIQTRATEAVPFLGDADAYAAIVDGNPSGCGRLHGHDAYPYSSRSPRARRPDRSRPLSLNYLRNSVKVVIDAYDGTITYYADLSDRCSRRGRGLPRPVHRHRRGAGALAALPYPENLLQIKPSYTNYHVTDDTAFYQQRDFWQVPRTRRGTRPPARSVPIAPYPAAEDPAVRREASELVLPFVPDGRSNMVGWMAASSDPANYEVTVFRFPEGATSRGPGQIFLADEPGPDVLRAAIAPGHGGIGHPVRRSPRDPGRGFVPLRPPGLRPLLAALGDPGAETRPGRQRQRGRRDRGRLAP